MIRFLQLIFLLSLTSAMFSQDCVLDSLWQEDWDVVLEEWQVPDRTHYEYDGDLLKVRTYPGNNTQIYLYEYDSEDRLTSRILQTLNSDSTWIVIATITYSGYDQFDNYTKYVSDRFVEGVVTSTRTECRQYDDAGNIFERSVEHINGDEIIRSTTEEYVNEYYPNGLLHTVVKKTWNNEPNELLSETRTTYEYDEDGRIVAETEERKDDDSVGFDFGAKTTYEYESDLLIKEYRYYSWFGSDNFVLDELVYNIYNDDRQLSREEILQFNSQQKIRRHFATDYSYDPCGPVKTKSFTSRNFNTNEWLPYWQRTYFYSALTSTSDYAITELNVYPNPVHDRLYIRVESKDDMRAEIFTLDGRVLMQTAFAGNQYVDVGHLETGSYVLRLSAGTQVYSSKFIKL